MGRTPRVQYEGASYHIGARGVSRMPILQEDADRLLFLSLLRRARLRFHWVVYAYCLMGNHYHIVLSLGKPNLSRGMAWLNGMYARAFNSRHSRSGHLFEKRFFSRMIETDAHLMEEIRYVLLNPVRASITDSPSLYGPSSCAAVTGAGGDPRGIVDDEAVHMLFGATRKDGRARLAEFLGETPCTVSAPSGRPGSCATNSHGPRSGRNAEAYRSLRRILISLRSADAARRNSAVRRACRDLGYPQKRMAERLGLSEATVSRIVRRT